MKETIEMITAMDAMFRGQDAIDKFHETCFSSPEAEQAEAERVGAILDECTAIIKAYNDQEGI